MRNAIGRLVVVVVITFVTTHTAAAQAPTSAARPATLPPAALKAFQQAYPGATITTTLQERIDGKTLFRVDSNDKGRRRVVLYDSAGSALEVAEQVEEHELPPPVAASMHSHPRAIFVSAMKVTRGSNVEYRLTVRGTTKTAMVAKPDGTVVSFK